MIEGKRVLCVIPARSGSKGLPDKNIRPLHGQPLLTWPVKTARNSRYIDRIIVSTDSEQYAAIARDAGAEVPFLRPEELSVDSATSFSVLEHLIATLDEDYDLLVLLEPTSPLTESRDVDDALEQLINAWNDADAIVGIAEEVKSHPAYLLSVDNLGRIQPFDTDFSSAVRRQELPQLFRMDGTLYISKVPALLAQRGFYHDRTLGYCVPEWKSYEIDSLTDFICIEAIMRHKEVLHDTAP
ncbi:MAG: acylneuraminate cytidylyltransferase [Oceanospirillaceae bacterium]|mgnify:CR=1 FL=1|nr:acylneuraminate cytidylyltransferase [Oceanospirillaceae bacterium]|tara:strand:- start:1750 stop:2472 length:723 start_codon:yes stop_codon:yes gene_type:complete